MRQFLLFFCFFLFWGCAPFVFSQQKIQDTNRLTRKERITQKRARIKTLLDKEDPAALDYYTHGFLWGGGIGTAGWHVTGRWIRTINPLWSYHIRASISELFDPRERLYYPVYVMDQFAFRGSNTVDSKVVTPYPLMVGIGANRYIGNKATNNGRFLQLHGTTGLSFALVKPYHIEIVSAQDKSVTIRYDEVNQKYYTRETRNKTKGRTFENFFYGWDQIEVNPGLFLEVGARYGRLGRKKSLYILNVGMRFEYYTRPITILLDENNGSLFFQFFVSIELGKIKMKK